MRADAVLTLSCPDRPGIVAAVSQVLFEHGANIEESQQFDDERTDTFFMRIAYSTPEGGPSIAQWRTILAPTAERLGMDWAVRDAGQPVRTAVLVSRFGHCLNDLLFRWRSGALNVDIPVVVSNHPDLEPLAAMYGIPFVVIPVTSATKDEAEAALREVVTAYDIDLVVLARYMQILSDDLSRELSGRVINIHHSFLPSFKGAKPYHQAFARGVKLVGATAHYVTADLDEGPIIEQDVARVDHWAAPERMVAIGRDVETQVLARAVEWHAEHRIIRDGHRTIVLR